MANSTTTESEFNMARRKFMASAAGLAPEGALGFGAEESVTQVVARLGVETVWAAVQRNARTSAGWLLIARRAAFAECLVETCRDMGLQTVVQVEAFVTRCGLSYAEVQGMFPAVELLQAGRDIVPAKLHIAAATQFSLSRQIHGDPADFRFEHFDASYKTLVSAEAVALAAAFPWRSAQLARKRQCEHLVTLFKGWCVQQGYADRAIGFAGLDLYDVGRYALAHAVPFVFTDDNGFLLLDNGKVFPPRQAKFFGCPQNVTNSKLRLLSI